MQHREAASRSCLTRFGAHALYSASGAGDAAEVLCALAGSALGTALDPGSPEPSQDAWAQSHGKARFKEIQDSIS